MIRKHFQNGITITEAVFAIAVFSLLVVTGYQLHITTDMLAVRGIQKTQALGLVEEGIEAVRGMRDENFSNLTPGTYGLTIASNKWQFLGTNDTTDSVFTRVVTITSVDTDNRQVTSSVNWTDHGRALSVSLSTLLSNWHKTAATMASALTFDTSGAYLSLLTTRRLLTNMYLISDGSVPSVTVTSVTTTWTTSSRRLQEIRSPVGTVVYSGNLTSGQSATLTTPITLTGASSKSFELYFNGNMNGATITITLTLSDGSIKAVTITNPPTGV